MTLDLDAAREAFAASSDGTVGIEEEFQILDPASLDLVPRYEELHAAAQDDPVLVTAVAGELIQSEIEIRSGRGEDLRAAVAQQREARRALFGLAEARGVALGATGTHPFADYRDQLNIQTEHYRRVVEGLQWVARRNNTFSLHVHVGIRDADRAVRICDRLRPVLPLLLGRLGELHGPGRPRLRPALGALAVVHEGLPALRHPGRLRVLGRLRRVHRPAPGDELDRGVHPGLVVRAAPLLLRHGRGAHLRRAEHRQESEGLAALITACVLQAGRDLDDGLPFADPPRRLVEENFWRAIRFGQDGRLIDFDRVEEYAAPTPWTGCSPGRRPSAPTSRSASRPSRPSTAPSASGGHSTPGADLREVHAAAVQETRDTYRHHQEATA
jgi:carboxylate-amine ligase